MGPASNHVGVRRHYHHSQCHQYQRRSARATLNASKQSKSDWLEQRLNLDDASLRKMILKYPNILGYSIEGNMEPTLDWLQQRLNLDDASLGKMIRKFPQILGLSIEDNLESTLD